MIIARAPVRISFAGGGTDLPSYYNKYGGMVVSTTIDKYFYVFLQPTPDPNLQVSSSDYHTFYRHRPFEEVFWNGDLGLPLAIFNHFGIRHGVSMFMASEIPPGTGLGSSSTVAVAIVKAVHTARGINCNPEEVAELAASIEIDKLGMPIGKQDQYAAACGGLNAYYFDSTGVRVEALPVSGETLSRLEKNILLFFTGTSRQASDILAEQNAASKREDPRVIQALHKVKALAVDMKDVFEKGDINRIGDLLDLSWEQKRKFASNVSNSRIDELYMCAKNLGARGGKIAGAGGGGFLVLYCEAQFQERVTDALEKEGLKRMDFHFETAGARVLLNTGLRLEP
jgi:D-glycero-alpha-D-manno-heptose-7-phosphate kinase